MNEEFKFLYKCIRSLQFDEEPPCEIYRLILMSLSVSIQRKTNNLSSFVLKK